MKKFTQRKEDFICENCGTKVRGNGYTNHCPNCLYSKDVDINPGDRKSICNGIMKPISIEIDKDTFIITHKCLKCGKISKCKNSENDNIEEIINISKNSNFIFGKK